MSQLQPSISADHANGSVHSLQRVTLRRCVLKSHRHKSVSFVPDVTAGIPALLAQPVMHLRRLCGGGHQGDSLSVVHGQECGWIPS